MLCVGVLVPTLSSNALVPTPTARCNQRLQLGASLRQPDTAHRGVTDLALDHQRQCSPLVRVPSLPASATELLGANGDFA